MAIISCIRAQSRNTIEEGRAASKSAHLKLAIFFLCPSKQFLPIPFQIQLSEYFPQIQKEQRHKQLEYTDKLVTTQT
jgi:hypothetical protein